MDELSYKLIGSCLEANIQRLLTASPTEVESCAQLGKYRLETKALVDDISKKESQAKSSAASAEKKAELAAELDKLNTRKEQLANMIHDQVAVHQPLRAVRREFVLTISWLIRSKLTALSQSLFTSILNPILFKELEVTPALVYEQDFGAFKKKMDDGLALRAAAHECLATVLDSAPNYLNLKMLVEEFKKGLKELDVDSNCVDLFNSTCMLYIKLCGQEPKFIIEALKSFDPLFLAAFKDLKKPYDAKKAGEVIDPKAVLASHGGEKNLEALRALSNLVMTMHRLPGAAKVAVGCTFTIAALRATPLLNALMTEQDAKNAAKS